MAENNDWGVYEKASIETRMFGQVDFEPYVGQTEKPGQSWDCSAEPSVVSRGFSVADLLLGIVVFGLLTRYSRVISPRDHRR